MRLSIIVLTYERTDALELVLRGLARQTVTPHEVIVTDDGSAPPTRALVQRLARELPPPVVYLTQEHRAARMARARNRGIAASSGDYVVFLDGDMVPERHFVEDHRGFARQGCFVQGSRVLASEELTRTLFAEQRLDVRFGEPGIDRRRHVLRNRLLRELYGIPNQRRGGVKSCNLAFWRDDLVRLNGFNEAMEGWGLEDVELVVRAFHGGLRRRDLRMGGSAVHLWHAPNYLKAENPNHRILATTTATGAVRCARGLDAHLPAGDAEDRVPDRALDLRYA
jgi:glycosyltransferase involved in cell wall biosynthesis